MPWAKLDDRFHENRKVKRAWRRCPAAIGLHAMAITYCAGNGTDGLVDPEFVEEKILKPREREQAIAALLEAGLWDEHPEGWLVHDFLEYNPSAERVEEARRAKSDAGRRGAEARWGSRDGKDVAPAIDLPLAPANGIALADDAPDPTPSAKAPPSPPRGELPARPSGNRKSDHEADRTALAEFAAVVVPEVDAELAVQAIRHARGRGLRDPVEIAAYVRQYAPSPGGTTVPSEAT